MLSRVANSMYWLGRYLERAENYARFLEVNFNLMLDLPPDLKEQWEAIMQSTDDDNLFVKKYKHHNKKNVINFLAFDTSNPNSIISSVNFARENARIIRDNLSKEAWEKMNELYHFVKKSSEEKNFKNGAPKYFFETVKNQILLLYGLDDSTVAKTEGWFFKQLGLYIERADKTSRILDVKYHILLPTPQMVGSPLDFLHWNALLKSVSGYNTYKKFYPNINPEGIVEFMILNKYFPRSVLYCLTMIEHSLNQVSTKNNSAKREIKKLVNELNNSNATDIIYSGLHEYIDNLQFKINGISDKIDENFFQIKDNFIHQK